MRAIATATAASLLFLALQGCTSISSSALEKKCIFGNCVEGVGIETTPRSGLYVGEWRNRERSGTGTYYDYFRHARYFGHWENGKESGQGTLFLSSGTLTGAWRNGAPDGVMTYVGADGTFKGTVGAGGYRLPGLFLQEGEVTWPSGEKYRGVFGNTPLTDFPHGVAEYETRDGGKINGTFRTSKETRFPIFSDSHSGKVVTEQGAVKYVVILNGPDSLIPFRFVEFRPIQPPQEKTGQ
jgi:hypothetical protein